MYHNSYTICWKLRPSRSWTFIQKSLGPHSERKAVNRSHVLPSARILWKSFEMCQLWSLSSELTCTWDAASRTEAELTKEMRGRESSHVLVPVDTAVDIRGPHMSSSRVAREETWSVAWKKIMMNLRRGSQMEMFRWVTLWAYLQRQGSIQEFRWLQVTDVNMMVFTECDIIFLLQLDILRYVIRVPIATFLLIPLEFMALVLKVLTNGHQLASHST